jgi:hypothetical protein
MSLFSSFAFQNNPCTSDIVTGSLYINSDFTNINSYPGSGSKLFNLQLPQPSGSMFGGTFNSNIPNSWTFTNLTNIINYGTYSTGSDNSYYTAGTWIKPTSNSITGSLITRGTGLNLNYISGSLSADYLGNDGFTYSVTSLNNTGTNVNDWNYTNLNFSSDNVSMYINGHWVGATRFTRTLPLPSSVIGWKFGGFSGLSISRVEVYSSSLSTDDIITNYNANACKYSQPYYQDYITPISLPISSSLSLYWDVSNRQSYSGFDDIIWDVSHPFDYLYNSGWIGLISTGTTFTNFNQKYSYLQFYTANSSTITVPAGITNISYSFGGWISEGSGPFIGNGALNIIASSTPSIDISYKVTSGFTSNVQKSGSVSIDTTKFNYLFGVIDYPTHTFYLYVNGVLSITYTPTTFYSLTTIGCHPNIGSPTVFATSGLSGKVNDFEYYSGVALTQSQIIQLYNAKASVFEQPLI